MKNHTETKVKFLIINIMLLALLLPLSVCGQNKESKHLYQKGMELLDAKKYEEALPYFQKSDSLDKARLRPTHQNYYRADLKLAECCAGLAEQADLQGKYTEAAQQEKRTMEIYKKIYGEDDSLYARSLMHLSCYYSDGGNITDAIQYGTMAMEITKKIFGEQHPNYATTLNNLAAFNDDIGKYEEAIRLTNIAIEIKKKTIGEENPSYVTSLNNLALYYSHIKNYEEAIRLGTMAIELKKKIMGENNPSFAIALCNLGAYHYHTGNYDEAIRLETRAMEITKETIGEEHPFYSVLVQNLSLMNFKAQKYDEAIRIGNIALGSTKKTWGEDHQHYARTQNALAGYYFVVGNYEKTAYYHQLSCKRITAFILKNFASMSYNDRSSFWTLYSHIYSQELPYFAYKVASEPSYKGIYAALAYNGLVLTKGLLLNSEIEIQKLIEQSGDTTFANRYNKIKNDRELLDQLNQMPIAARPKDADSLLEAIETEERLLVQSSQALGDYTQKLSISWQDVQRNLNDGDLAIEFATVKDTSAKQLIYVALVLKKGMTAPELVTLYNSDDFYDIKTKEYYTTTKLYNLVWKPLAQYLNNAKNVYFSPAGRIHTIGVEYLTDESGKFFAQKYNTYRLSSTRELALTRQINPSRKATTYGGIKYDFSDDDWQRQKGATDSMQTNYRDIPIIADNLRGGGMGYLNGTRQESETIAKLLRSANYNVTAMSDAAATEESFKQLSGSGLKVLHIGTHGFYETEEDLENANLSFYTSSNQNDEDRSLSCSGLLFAGANSALDPHKAKNIPEGVDDGILTAKEISRLDFKGLDLVVLSACQTGLGEITGEGVFGLQRGFKKAGAQTIVMSLWKVSDEATQMLMIEFFKNLTAGQPKRAAFLAAQEAVRAKYPNPIYWAAFVMVDGIN